MKRKVLVIVFMLITGFFASEALAQKSAVRAKEEKIAAKCVSCHKKKSPGIVNDWKTSQHARGRVTCYDCHKAEKTDADVQEHEGALISVIVSPRDCSRCHPKEAREFQESHHSKASTFLSKATPEGRIMDNILGYKVEGKAAAVVGCEKCHGSKIEVTKGGALTPDSWPNQGIGRINPDGSAGSCTACHSRHKFSIGEARKPETCGTCHIGPDHPHIEIYMESKHGVIYSNEKESWNWDVAGSEWDTQYYRSPTCATCHMSGIGEVESTHNVDLRLSWYLAKPRSEPRDNWEENRETMQKVCLNCHSINWVKGFYKQGDDAIRLYNEKFYDPIKAEMDKLYEEGLLTKEKFDEELEFTFFEYWHHEGRRARAGFFMMGADYAQWHGFYELARNKLELERLIKELREEGRH
ncbi:Hydroxylamine oxidoreductase (Fragment) [hydrothermal vent metagenome]|uniref:Hydroxylamine oxidoreductase n=1 Tax=hydrothermal vent metagenome TaxID=652676 RepID=A0A3B1DAU3_9ZZZZ